MTTSQYSKDGKCRHFKPIRVKIWDSGFSIKCVKSKKTLVGRPFNEYFLYRDLAFFCVGCEQAC